MTRTIDEIKAYYGELLETFNKLEGDSKNDDWVGEQVKEAWLLLDYINTLEAQVQAVGEWESVENPPPFICAEQSLPYGEVDWIDIPEGGELPMGEDMEYFSQPLLLQVEAVGCFYGYDEANGEIETRFEIDESKVIGWQYLKEQP